MEWKLACNNCFEKEFKPYPEYVRQDPDCYDHHIHLHQLPMVPNISIKQVECCNCGTVYKVIPPRLERMITQIKFKIKLDI